MFSTSLQAALVLQAVTVSIYVDGVRQDATQRTNAPVVAVLGVLDVVPVATQGIATVNGSQAIEIRWRTSLLGVASAFERSLTLLQIA
jgi:hypothetical protein